MIIRPVITRAKAKDRKAEYKYWIRIIWEQPESDYGEPEYLDYLFNDWQDHDSWIGHNLPGDVDLAPDYSLENFILARQTLIYGDPDLDLVDDFILHLAE